MNIDQLVRYGLGGGLPVTIIALSILLGAIALQTTPREEEPQIVVPVVDVLVESPGLSARQVERQVTTPLEKLLSQITGVEHVYSTSLAGSAIVTLRFHVGEDRETAILNSYNKLHANQDRIPGVVSQWQLRPVEVDDVPVVILGLWTAKPAQTSDYELRRVAEEVSTLIQSIDNTSIVDVTGGRPRTVTIRPDPEALAARRSTPLDIVDALSLSNRLVTLGDWTLGNQSLQLESGDVIRSVAELQQLVINVVDSQPILLRDVAVITDGPAEPDQYTWIQFPAHPDAGAGAKQSPMVAISVAKQRGSNAVQVAADVHELINTLRQSVLPDDIRVTVLRDYGQTADEKVNQLALSLALAVLTVIVFIAVFLGPRQALVVGIAVPIAYGITLALDWAFGYTINRVTLFALILSLGLLVDDPITGIDNISRFLAKTGTSSQSRIVSAISEIKVPLLMSTVTIILAFLPLAFITGMMGPYMAPMAFNVPVSVIISTMIAFLVTPWLAQRILGSKQTAPDITRRDSVYRRLMTPLLTNRSRAHLALALVGATFIAACLLPLTRSVPLKLLPFDNKNELQVIIDMPESATLESTAAMAQRVANATTRLPEVNAVAAFVGTPSPMDFNGLVRRYYLRQSPWLADLRVTLLDKSVRHHQSHGVVLRLRQLLAPLSSDGVSIKVVEVPPGPPVMSTLVAEVYGTPLTPYEDLQSAAEQLAARLAREPLVSEIDTGIEADRQRLRFVIDKAKAALSGIATSDINATLGIANDGLNGGYLPFEDEARPLPVRIQLAQQDRATMADLTRIQVRGRTGIAKVSSRSGLDSMPQPLVPLGELGELGGLAMIPADRAIHHKDLAPVVYVTAEISGRTPVEAITDLHVDQNAIGQHEPNNWQDRTFFNPGGGDSWQLDEDIDVVWTGEGEWKITVDVFRDMGLGYLFALIAIFFVLRLQTASYLLSLIIMLAIPLTVIGIMPGFWILNHLGEREIAGNPDPVLFTATAMIGMIALAGIVVRNSLILVEYITQARDRGAPLVEALLEAGTIRLRPILLTAGTTLLGNLIITLDPVFSGLALAIIFGIFASTLFTLIVVPIVYLLVFDTTSHEGQTS
jgi:multidrug efflux pump subunit AcrB